MILPFPSEWTGSKARMTSGKTWEVEVGWCAAGAGDPRASDLRSQLHDRIELGESEVRVSDLYYVDGEVLDEATVELAARSLLTDPVTQDFSLRYLGDGPATPGIAVPGTGAAPGGRNGGDGGGPRSVATILKRPGVMDPVEASIRLGMEDLGIPGVRARTGVRVSLARDLDAGQRRNIAEKVLSNPAIEEVYWNEEALPPPFPAAAPSIFQRREVRLEGLSDEALLEVSHAGQLSLSLPEMQTVRDYFAGEGRPPTDVELETIAQTWSEHCCHKTLTAAIEHTTEGSTVSYGNLLKETIGRVTDELRARETQPFCLSVFRDNAGVIAFDEDYGLSFKVETHNHPSAIEPYGGAGTGIGGVLRDTLGTGLGAKPIVNTNVFCLGPPDLSLEDLPPGALHPLRVLKGVVGGVRDYGNRMGIPTASGALFFDERYVANPLVYCGSVGLLPRWAVEKSVEPGDRIVVLGGRTGRDGIHGATFSSVELTEESESVSTGAVQIGNAITEKKLLDVLLVARDRRLFHSVTDCGAGGFSSAVGEMGSQTGARVDLEKVKLKYEGLSYWEIWISEAQERMVIAVPPRSLEEVLALATSEDVECTDIGEFTDSGRLDLFYDGQQVCDLDMSFLYEGRPSPLRRSSFEKPTAVAPDLVDVPRTDKILERILASPNVASKEWVIRQYDHEVQGHCMLKPLQGPCEGPGDGVVFTARFDSAKGFAIGCGMNPCYGDLDPYRMALSALDEALRNVVAVGGDPSRAAVLDNFCWGNTERPETLGSLVEAARGCHDGALALGTPFISGKDSLNNEYRVGESTLSIPSSLLISSLAIIDDVRKIVSMDLKTPGHRLFLVGETRAELGGSHLLRVLGRSGGTVPDLDPRAGDVHRAVCRAITGGLVRSCHDLSEGGLAVAAAEMAFSGDVGAEILLSSVKRGDAGDRVEDDLTILFSESNSRYLLEVAPEDVGRLLELFGPLPVAEIGRTIEYRILRIMGLDSQPVIAKALDDLRRCWRDTLSF